MAWSKRFIPKLFVWHTSRDIVRMKWRYYRTGLYTIWSHRIFNISLQQTYLHWPVSMLEFLQPHKRKINRIGTLVHRAFMICSKGKLDPELDKILSILLENGYPENLNKSATKRKLNNLTWTRSTQWKNAQFTYTFHGSDTFRWSSKNRSRLPWSAASFPSNHMLFLRPDSSYQQQRKTCYLPTIKTT